MVADSSSGVPGGGNDPNTMWAELQDLTILYYVVEQWDTAGIRSDDPGVRSLFEFSDTPHMIHMVMRGQDGLQVQSTPV